MTFLIENCKWLFAAVCLVEIPLVAWYIKSLGNRKPYKVKKMVCSSLFVLAGCFAAVYNDEFSVYYMVVLIGLVLSWLGDLFLAFSLRGKWFILGLGSFLLAHVAYVVAFSFGIVGVTGTALPAWYEFVIVAAMLALCFVVKNKCDIKLGEMKIPVLFYAVTISAMLARAVHLGIAYISAGLSAGLTFGFGICLMIVSGALLFVASDSVLVFIIFKNLSNKKTETANLVTYYAAQLIFAASMFFIC